MSDRRAATADAPKTRRRRSWRWRPPRWLGRALLWVCLLLAGGPVAWTALYGVVGPPATPLMLLRLTEGEGLDYRWVPMEAISPHLAAAVIAAEDNHFCRHRGFDFGAISEAWQDLREGRRLRGGSTISNQTAKNAFLWPGRNFLRKGVEAYFTALIETLWSKRRILEVYLNIVEWAPGVYGAEAAARHHFNKSAADLTVREATLLAVVLPNPRHWSASQPTSYITRRAQVMQTRIGQIRPLLDCY